MKKKIALISFIAVLIAAVCVIIVVRHKAVSDSDTKSQSFDTIEEAEEACDFNLQYSDRLSGYPATAYKASSNTIEVQYGGAGFVRKTYSETKANTGAKYEEKSTEDINGMPVTFSGKDGKVFLAEWNTNGFYYTISISDSAAGAEADEMAEYVAATL